MVDLIFELRNWLNVANAKLRIIHSKAVLPLNNLQNIIGQHNADLVIMMRKEIVQRLTKIQETLERSYGLAKQ